MFRKGAVVTCVSSGYTNYDLKDGEDYIVVKEDTLGDFVTVKPFDPREKQKAPETWYAASRFKPTEKLPYNVGDFVECLRTSAGYSLYGIETKDLLPSPFVNLHYELLKTRGDSAPIESNGGSTPAQYELPEWATELQDLIEYRGMNFAQGNIFKACYRKDTKNGATWRYDLNKIIFFAERELARLDREGIE